MKILVIAKSFPKPNFYAPGAWVLEQVKAYRRVGLDPVVLCPVPKLSKLLKHTRFRKWTEIPDQTVMDGIQVFYQPTYFYPHPFIKYFLYPRLPWLETLLMWLGLAKKVDELHMRFGFDLVHCHHLLPEGFFGKRIKKRYGLPLVVTEHSFKDLETSQAHVFRKKIMGEVLDSCDAVVTVSQKMADLIQNLGWIAEVNWNGVGLEQVDRILEDDLQEEKMILSVASFIERKGHAVTIRAFSRLNEDFKLVLVGNGPKKKEMEQLVVALDLPDRVNFKGLVTHQEVLSLMARCAIFALPSWDEPFATVYPEAMSFGKPIIACRGEGTDDVINSGVNGVLIKKKDEDDLFRALKSLSEDSSLRNKIGQEARRTVDEKLSWEANALRMKNIFQKI